MKAYVVNEIFRSLQGEGHLAGTTCIFVRFTGCNLTCSIDTEGFDCDTEFRSGRKMTAAEIVEDAYARCAPLPPGAVGVIFTGGEPALQLDAALADAFVDRGFADLRIETNGTVSIDPKLLGRLWISCSPKTAEHTLRVAEAVSELRYVRRRGMGIPQPLLKASHRFISPAWGLDGIDPADMDWCVNLVLENPGWRLSVQQHKGWRMR